MGRWTRERIVGLMSGMFSVAPCEPMESPRACTQTEAAEVALHDEDPALGRFQGMVDWLQTEERTELVFDVSPVADTGISECGQESIELRYTFSSEDTLLVGETVARTRVGPGGFLAGGDYVASIDVLPLVEDGKAPDVLARDPTVSMAIESASEDTRSVEVVLESEADRLHLAMGELQKISVGE